MYLSILLISPSQRYRNAAAWISTVEDVLADFYKTCTLIVQGADPTCTPLMYHAAPTCMGVMYP